MDNDDDNGNWSIIGRKERHRRDAGGYYAVPCRHYLLLK